MYRVGIAAQFGLDAYGAAPAVALPPDGQRLALWHRDDLAYVALNGDPIDVEDGQARVIAMTLLSILRDPALMRWICTRVRPLTMVPYYPWAVEKLGEFEHLVIKRIVQIQKLAGATGGEVESVVWDWEPGQAAGRVAVQLLTQRVFYPFTLRGHTLGFRERVSNVTVPLAHELEAEAKMVRPELRGEIFPEDTDAF